LTYFNKHFFALTSVVVHNVANATSERIWVQLLLTELGISQGHALVMWCDNIGATHLFSNAAFYARMKHIDIL
jgi:hypothetical protein